jgi:hypothetical protein
MFYQWQWCDVVMVIAVIPMLMYQFLLVRPDVKKMLKAPDVLIFLLIALLTVSFLRDTVSYREYIKVLSAFLLFFMGRLYYDRIQECNDALAISSYLIVYLNFFYRIVRFGAGLFRVSNADGDFYYYDTDMAYAMILAFVFIAMFAKKSVLKIITLVLVCPYMILFSDADIQKIIFVMVIAVLMLYFVDVALRKRTVAMAGMGILIAISIVGVVMIYLPLVDVQIPLLDRLIYSSRILNPANMKSRYFEWQNVIAANWPSDIPGYLLGIGMNTSLPLKSLYLKIIYSLGIVGIVLSGLLAISVCKAALNTRDRRSFYILAAIAFLTFLSGVTINSMETTQMSWFVMLFAGMVVSAKEETVS